MKFNYLKEKKEFVSIVLFCFSAFLGMVILIKLAGLFVVPAMAKHAVNEAIAKSKYDPNEVEKHLVKSRAVAEELKKKNLFAPPAPKKNPVSKVTGILGDSALINGKWYKVGDKVGDANVAAIEPTYVKIVWEGKEKNFSPIGAATTPTHKKEKKKPEKVKKVPAETPMVQEQDKTESLSSGDGRRELRGRPQRRPRRQRGGRSRPVRE